MQYILRFRPHFFYIGQVRFRILPNHQSAPRVSFWMTWQAFRRWVRKLHRMLVSRGNEERKRKRMTKAEKQHMFFLHQGVDVDYRSQRNETYHPEFFMPKLCNFFRSIASVWAHCWAIATITRAHLQLWGLKVLWPAAKCQRWIWCGDHFSWGLLKGCFPM